MDPRRLLLLSLLLWARSEAEVVESVSNCTDFFLLENPPQIPGVLENGEILAPNRYKPICQTYENHQRFFTLYDTANKIPVFSAYTFKGNEEGATDPEKPFWMTEPQLERNMQQPINKDKKSQACENDYENPFGYESQQLYPSAFGHTQPDKKSTFTFTNTVPQKHTFITGSWKRMESCTKCVMEKFCRNNNDRIEGFLVTGAEPGNNLLNNKINIPSMVWTAFCCYSKKESKWLTGAHWGDSDSADQFLETKTLDQLYSRFNFTLFPAVCPSDTTVTEFYPELNAENQFCNCPPTRPTTASPKLSPSVMMKSFVRQPSDDSLQVNDDKVPVDRVPGPIENAVIMTMNGVKSGVSGAFAAVHRVIDEMDKRT